jgi:hypothetical protein
LRLRTRQQQYPGTSGQYCRRHNPYHRATQTIVGRKVSDCRAKVNCDRVSRKSPPRESIPGNTDFASQSSSRRSHGSIWGGNRYPFRSKTR